MNLPEGYAYTTDIYITGQPYIDTGVVPDEKTEIYISFEIPDNLGSYDSDFYLFGARAAVGRGAFAVIYSAADEAFRVEYGGGYYLVPGEIIGLHSVRLGAGVCTIDGQAAALDGGEFSAGCTVCIGGVNTGGVVRPDFIGTLGSCEIYQDGVTIRDFVTCRDKFEKGGLWDNANGVFYGNAGSGTITYGAAAVMPFPLNMIRYRTAADAAAKNLIGVYNAGDLNRVAEAARIVRDLIYPLGYNTTPEIPQKEWQLDEIPRASGLRAHHEAVIGQDVLGYAKEKHVLPESLSKLDYEGANSIERFLYDTYFAAQRIPEGYVYCGEVYGGNDL